MLTDFCAGASGPPSNQAVWNEIKSVILLNAPDVATGSWSAFYVDSNESDIPTSPNTYSQVTNNNGQYPPTTPAIACGVRVSLTPSWTPYIAKVVGSSTLTANASARSVNHPGQGNPIAIVALDQVNPHQVLGGGRGAFDVFGTIFANSSVPYHPWDASLHQCDPQPPANGNYSACPTKSYIDVVDAKGGSQLILHGEMQTVGGTFPLDWCFGTTAAGWGVENGGPPNNPAPPGAHTPDPYNNALCHGGTSVTLKYDHIATSKAQIADPLDPSQGGFNDPFVTTAPGNGYYDGLCPGQASPQPYPPTGSGIATTILNAGLGTVSSTGVLVLEPGDYANPIQPFSIAGVTKVVFDDCAGFGYSGYPGIFRFQGGLDLRPGTNQSATGSNVMIATANPFPLAGNVPGSVSGGKFVASGTGNGAPCQPGGSGASPKMFNDSTGKNAFDSTKLCGGTASLPGGPYYSSLTYRMGGAGGSSSVDPTPYGTGTNFSLILGGLGPITLGAPQSGPFKGIAAFQKRSVPANFGFDSQPGDAAAITVNGLVYNASETCYGYAKKNPGQPASPANCDTAASHAAADPFDYWDDGIPFRDGGILQTGLGASPSYPSPSGGSVTVNGPTVVADFNTDGNTTIVIDGRANQIYLPGVIGSGNPAVSG
jgi:hypothetical protein